MRLTEREKRILEALYTYDGVLSFSQLQRLFFTGKSQTELRLRLFYQNGYLTDAQSIPQHEQKHRAVSLVRNNRKEALQ